MTEITDERIGPVIHQLLTTLPPGLARQLIKGGEIRPEGEDARAFEMTKTTRLGGLNYSMSIRIHVDRWRK